MDNVIVYLIGFHGVGKLTTAQALCEKSNLRLIDNHLINNVVFSFLRKDGKTKIPPLAWMYTEQVRDIALDALVYLAPEDMGFVFTNSLFQDSEQDHLIFKKIESAAQKRKAVFLPVRLICEKEQHKERIVSSERTQRLKTTNVGLIDEMNKTEALRSGHANEITVDITHSEPDKTAEYILNALYRLSGY